MLTEEQIREYQRKCYRQATYNLALMMIPVVIKWLKEDYTVKRKKVDAELLELDELRKADKFRLACLIEDNLEQYIVGGKFGGL